MSYVLFSNENLFVLYVHMYLFYYISNRFEIKCDNKDFHAIYCILTQYFRFGTDLQFFHRYNVFFTRIFRERICRITTELGV